MPDLRPSAGFIDTGRLAGAPPLEAVFQAGSAGEASRLQAERRLVPTLRLEDAVRSLTRLGVDLESIRVVPIGIERSWRGEVVGQWPAPGADVHAGTPILLFVTLPGLQDRLPDGILPSPATRDPRHAPAIDPSEAADELLLEHRELDPARRLLQILDGWMGRVRAHLARLQDAYDATGPAGTLARFLLDQVGLGGLPADEERAVWLSGALHRLPGVLAVPGPTGELLTELIDEPVIVVEGAPAAIEIPEEFRCRLGARNTRLGRDLVAGRAFSDARPAATLLAGPESAPEARAAATDPDRRRRAAAWCEAVLPCQGPSAARRELLPGDRRMTLGRRPANSVLGVTTILRQESP
jgi:hypothetical protein